MTRELARFTYRLFDAPASPPSQQQQDVMHIGITRERAARGDVIRARGEAVRTDGRRLVNFQLTGERVSGGLDGGPEGLQSTTTTTTTIGQVTVDLIRDCASSPPIKREREREGCSFRSQPGLIGARQRPVLD